ncbi:ABC transporter permease [Pelagibacterium luteolum]|uniref:Peptide/nickel transport system permease protein n=1 Tax=Pelagibacterium luteolum TaxID=440168 RepID=A0A1G7Z942_9HYPH|nr:ABC transporter permease [Pelagibacterium luteolum]SDH05117.1 peptide/nickel transport system permease protein [Pelagibacterium luteolum]
MINFLLARIGSAIITIFGASILAFVILRAVPTNPARLIAGPFANDEVIAQVTSQLGLDKPLFVQYFDYIVSFFAGDWGFSYSAGQPVLSQIVQRLPASAELALYAFLFAFIGAVFVTVLVSFLASKWLDRLLRLLSFISVGVPPFWLALLFLMVFFEQLGWFPGPVGRGPAPGSVHTGLFTIDYLIAGNFSGFATALHHLALPALALALGPFGYLVRLLRANLLDIVNEPFVTVLHAKGVAPVSTHFQHILPNAFLPTLTAGGLILAQLLGGSVLVERIFVWPGIGTLVIDGILRQDYAVVQAFIMLSAIIYIGVNLLVDILYGYVDPRVRRS